MSNGIYRKSRAELEALAAEAADRKAWNIFNRLVAEMSARDRYDRPEPVTITVPLMHDAAVPVAA